MVKINAAHAKWMFHFNFYVLRLFLSLQLQCVEGNILVASGENKMEVPMLKPDEQGELAVPFIAPATPGHYERYAACPGTTCACVIANISSNHLSI